MSFTVFVSHCMSFEDLFMISELTKQANTLGINFYIAENDYQLGNSLPNKIEAAINNCDVLIALWTKGGSNSAYVNQEIGYARAKGKKRILLVENGITVKGFEVDKEYLSFDKNNPFQAVSILKNNLALMAQLKSVEEIKDKNMRNFVLFTLGALAVLLLISDY
jgi:hypothetical protein